MPKVYNKHHGDAPPDAVYIGRGSVWGNLHVIGNDGTRDEVIKKHKEDIDKLCRVLPHFRESLQKALRGRDMVCFCKPHPCHGDYLLEIANEE